MKNKIDTLILAAGKGTRMKSDLPKVLTPVAGEPIIIRLINSIKEISPKPILVVGHMGEMVIAAVGNSARFVFQKEQKGTGHAVKEALEQLDADGEEVAESLIVMPGDHPLVKAETFRKLAEDHEKSGSVLTFATLTVPNYEGDFSVFNHYGRVLRDENGTVLGIKEFKDGTEAERNIKEVNPSYYCFDTAWLKNAIKRLRDGNVSHEFYLTDVVEIAVKEGKIIHTIPLSDFSEAMGINTPEQKNFIESSFFQDLVSG